MKFLFITSWVPGRLASPSHRGAVKRYTSTGYDQILLKAEVVKLERFDRHHSYPTFLL